MVDVGQDADVGVVDGAGDPGALFDGVDEVAFVFVERLDDDGDAVLGGNRAHAFEQFGKLGDGLFGAKALGDAAGCAAAEDDDGAADGFGAGEGGAGIVENLIVDGVGADAFEVAGQEACVRIDRQCGGGGFFQIRGEFIVRLQRGEEFLDAFFDIIVACGLDFVGAIKGGTQADLGHRDDGGLGRLGGLGR